MMTMDAGAVAWLNKTARRNAWRVCAWYELDDLVQDGWVHFCRVVNRYENVRAPAHIMALFKTTYLNHLHDLSKKRTRGVPELLVCDLITTDENEAQFLETKLGFDHELATCFTAVMRASEPVKQLLRSIVTDRGIKALRSRGRVFHDRTQETINDKLCRIAGCSRQYDIVGALREVLST